MTTVQEEIILTKNQVEVLTKHARECIPNESCAILFGKVTNEKFLALETFLTKNIENSSDRFTISNEELIKAYDEAEKKSFDVIAVFHSHPYSEAYPSSTDIKYMETNPVPWIIYSNFNNDLNAYIFDSKVIQIRVIVA